MVHLCNYSNNQWIQLECDASWDIASWEDEVVIEGKVYRRDDDKQYTFNTDCVTCEKCLKKTLTDS